MDQEPPIDFEKIKHKLDPAKIKHEMKIRREAIQIMMGDLNMLSKLLEAKIGKIEYLKYMEEVGKSAQGDIFGQKREGETNESG